MGQGRKPFRSTVYRMLEIRVHGSCYCPDKSCVKLYHLLEKQITNLCSHDLWSHIRAFHPNKPRTL